MRQQFRARERCRFYALIGLCQTTGHAGFSVLRSAPQERGFPTALIKTVAGNGNAPPWQWELCPSGQRLQLCVTATPCGSEGSREVAAMRKTVKPFSGKRKAHGQKPTQRDRAAVFRSGVCAGILSAWIGVRHPPPLPAITILNCCNLQGRRSLSPPGTRSRSRRSSSTCLLGLCIKVLRWFVARGRTGLPKLLARFPL